MNEGYIYREQIDGRGAGTRLRDYLSGRYAHSTPAEWDAHIAAGRVVVDGAAVAADLRLRAGQTLEWHRPPWDEPEAPLELPILYAAGSVLAVAKPAGLPTLPGGGFLQHTLLHQIRAVAPTASPMHRLGRWTSGVVLCALTPEAGAALTAQFKARTVHKRYRALASGRPMADAFAIDVPIGPVPYGPLGTVHAASEAGRPASSQVEVIERRADSFLCDVRIATGRPHQIRIHLAASGHPLVGDPLYLEGGRPAADGTALPGDPGYRLHAAELRFDEPTSGERITVLDASADRF